MTMEMKCARRLALPVAVLAALLLTGCSSGHIGEDWQCPLAKGGSCDSVAAADPAVPKTGSVRAKVPGQPLRLLPRENDTGETATPSMEMRRCEADCGFDPFAWLARLFGAEADDDRPVVQDTEPAITASIPDMAVEATPAAEEDAGADDRRTGETVARIWIAPFVDADGIYREAAHVRVVLEPAGWRLR